MLEKNINEEIYKSTSQRNSHLNLIGLDLCIQGNKQSVSQLASQSVRQFTGQSASQQASQPGSQPARQTHTQTVTDIPPVQALCV